LRQIGMLSPPMLGRGTTKQLVHSLDKLPFAFVILAKEKHLQLHQLAANAHRFTVLQETETGVVVFTENRQTLDN